MRERPTRCMFTDNMADLKVVILDTAYRAYEEERRVLRSINAEVTAQRGEDSEQVRGLLSDADELIVNLHPIDAGVIAGMSKCRVISRYGVGYDNVDTEAATEAGIWVTNVPDYATEDVSDHAIALLLACVRKVTLRDSRVRKGEWNLKDYQQSRRTAGKVMGILGLGKIGTATALKLTGFNFSRVIAHDPYIEPDAFAKAGAEAVSFDELVTGSDYISIHVPLNDETRGMIDAGALRKMKESAIIINTARGGVIDTDSLIEALKRRGPAYAGLDVHEQEPLPANSPLFMLDNVVLTDHCAWYTEESIVEVKTRAAENVASVLRGEVPKTPVNSIRHL